MYGIAVGSIKKFGPVLGAAGPRAAAILKFTGCSDKLPSPFLTTHSSLILNAYCRLAWEYVMTVSDEITNLTGTLSHVKIFSLPKACTCTGWHY